MLYYILMWKDCEQQCRHRLPVLTRRCEPLRIHSVAGARDSRRSSHTHAHKPSAHAQPVCRCALSTRWREETEGVRLGFKKVLHRSPITRKAIDATGWYGRDVPCVLKTLHLQDASEARFIVVSHFFCLLLIYSSGMLISRLMQASLHQIFRFPLLRHSISVPELMRVCQIVYV